MIVITTPTGQIGSQVLDRLLDGEEPIRLIARDPARLSARARERVEIVQGSHQDSAVVTRALAGADSALWVVPPDPSPSAEGIAGHYIDFTRPLCEAIAGQGLSRVVGVSSVGRGIARKAGPVSAALGMDALIESTGVHYRSLSMLGFMDNLLTQLEPIIRQGLFFSPLPGDRRSPTCATRDIAAEAARLLRDDSWHGQQDVPLLGAEDLSFHDMARIMSDVLGYEISFRRIPVERFKATLIAQGMPEAWAQGLLDMHAQFDQGINGTELRTTDSTTRTSFRQWCVDVLKPRVIESI